MRVVTFGEIMLRLNPIGYKRFIQAETYEASYSGGEANVAVSLSNFGIDSLFVSKVPSHEIGQSAINSLQRYGVDPSFIKRGGERLGIYFLEKGASQRPSKVIYDRAHSSLSLVEEDEFDWEKIFEGVDWFHFTGITPALGGNLPTITLQACKKAKERGITISCDLNYRKKLWTKEEAGKVMSTLLPYVDVVIANEEDASDVFNIQASNTDITSGELNKLGYEEVAKEIIRRFGPKKVAITLRKSISASTNEWAGMMYDGKNSYFSPQYMMNIVDRVGGGDSFASGIIYALLNNYDPQNVVNFAVSASCLKHSIEGDFNQVSVDEVNVLMKGDASGRVQR
ncbi:MAG: sugar kinase [Spirochaetia bacterium]|nr:sugar kinase [Spirochaetia bacterium]